MAGKRLKVYSTRIGFQEWLVAAPSQKAALEAWDVRKNLFATGAAKVVTDPKAVALALKNPGGPVARDEDAGSAKASRVVHLKDRRKRKSPPHSSSRRRSKAKKTPKLTPAKADRTRLDRAEEAIEEFHKRAARERNAIIRSRKALDLEAEGLEAELDAEEERLNKALDKVRERFKAAS